MRTRKKVTLDKNKNNDNDMDEKRNLCLLQGKDIKGSSEKQKQQEQQEQQEQHLKQKQQIAHEKCSNGLLQYYCKILQYGDQCNIHIQNGRPIIFSLEILPRMTISAFATPSTI
jgi:hypothetical protein